MKQRQQENKALYTGEKLWCCIMGNWALLGLAVKTGIIWLSCRPQTKRLEVRFPLGPYYASV